MQELEPELVQSFMTADTWYKDWFVRNAEGLVLEEKRKKKSGQHVENRSVMIEESHQKMT